MSLDRAPRRGLRVELRLELATALELRRRRESGAQGQGSGSSRADEVRRVAGELGVALVPVHPGQVHELLAPSYLVEVPDQATAERTKQRL